MQDLKKILITFSLLLLVMGSLPLANAGNVRFFVVQKASKVSPDARHIKLLVQSNLIWSEVPAPSRPLLKHVLAKGLRLQSCNAMYMTKRLAQYVRHKGGTLSIRLVDSQNRFILITGLKWQSCFNPEPRSARLK